MSLQELIRRWDSECELLRIKCARKLPEFAEITQNNASTPFKVIQNHRFWHQSKAHIRFPILVINTNLHRFRDPSIGPKSQYLATPLVFNSPGGGVPLGRSPWNFQWMSLDGQGTKYRRNIAENCNRLSRVHERYRRQTDNRRQTDGRQHIANVKFTLANKRIWMNEWT